MPWSLLCTIYTYSSAWTAEQFIFREKIPKNVKRKKKKLKELSQKWDGGEEINRFTNPFWFHNTFVPFFYLTNTQCDPLHMYNKCINALSIILISLKFKFQNINFILSKLQSPFLTLIHLSSYYCQAGITCSLLWNWMQ